MFIMDVAQGVFLIFALVILITRLIITSTATKYSKKQGEKWLGNKKQYNVPKMMSEQEFPRFCINCGHEISKLEQPAK